MTALRGRSLFVLAVYCWLCLSVGILNAQDGAFREPTRAAPGSVFENPFRQPTRIAELPSTNRTNSAQLNSANNSTTSDSSAVRTIRNPAVVPPPSDLRPAPALSTPEVPTTSTAAVPNVTKEHIARQLESITQATDLDDATRANLLKRVNDLKDKFDAAEAAAAKAAQYTVEIQQMPRKIVDVKGLLSQPVPEVVIDLPPDTPLVQIEQQLSQTEQRLAESKTELAERESELKRRSDRHNELRKLVSEGTKRLEELQKQRVAPPPAGQKPLVTQVRQFELDVDHLLLQRELELFKLEGQRIDAAAELLPLERDLAKRNTGAIEKQVAAWQKHVDNARKAESLRQAAEARRQLENAHPDLRQVAERNAELAEMRRSIAAAIEKAAAESRQLDKQLAQLKGDFDKMQEKVQIAGLSKTIGILLRKQRADLNTSSTTRNWIRFIENELPAAQLTLIELEDERSLLGDIELSVQQTLENLAGQIKDEDRSMIEGTASNLITTKRELLDTLINDYNTYLKDLGDLELSSRRLIAETKAYADFVDKHVLWIRSSEPLGPEDVQKIGQTLLVGADAKLWLSMGENVFAGLIRRPVQGAIALILVLTLVIMRRRMFNRLATLCSADSANNVLNFRTTLEAVLLVFIASSVWPCLMWCAGWWLESSYDVSEFTHAMAAGLQRGAVFLWLFQFIRVSTRNEGIGETHFGWQASGTRVVRDNLFWLGAIGIPISVAVTVVDHWDDGQGDAALGRVAFMVGMVVVATAMHNIFRRQKGMFQEALARNPGGWLNRVRITGHLAGTGIPCILAVLAAAGYYYSARQLSIRFELTILIALVLVLMHGVLTRWFLVKRRNIAIRQARERRNTQNEHPVDAKGLTTAPVVTQDMTKIQSQLQYLLRYGATLAVLVVAWYVWADVLPALRILDRIVLWTSRTTVVETIPDATGSLRAEAIEKDVPTTLTHGLLAVLLTIGTSVLGRNLPALLEITILERLPIDHGGRHALSIILRYLVYLAGLLFVCRTLSVAWTSVQWLAAAMTVGLGFGLQEIFANLVSGLIILFERPIRVGDVVTVNGVTGTVSRMQIRATTITDFDRREMIVPNKKFITEDVINWTLSDPISRVTIDIGVLYGSDTSQAQTILLQLAQSHPLVLRDPAPVAIFKRFGEKTLEFSLHVFIANRSSYSAVVHDLNTRIDTEFRNAGIQMVSQPPPAPKPSVAEMVPVLTREPVKAA